MANRTKHKTGRVRYLSWIIAFFLVLLLPLEGLKNLLFLSSAVKIIFLIPFICLIWKEKGKIPVSAKIISTVSLLLLVFPSILFSRQVVLMLYILLFPCIIFCLIFFFKAHKKAGINLTVWICEASYLIIVFIVRLGDYSFIHSTPISFLFIGLIIGMFFSIIVMVKWFWGNNTAFVRIVIFLTLLIFSAIFFWGMLLHFNYTFDFNEPQIYTLEIEEKDIDGGKHVDYYFIFSIDEKQLKVAVPYSEFFSHEVGDCYSVKLHQGAFGKEFYISNETLE